MAVYCWGNATHGELGLGGIEDEYITAPREMDWSGAPNLLQAACGSTHTLLLTKDGKLYSCGNNDYGQLGHELVRKRPRMSILKPIETLDNYKITQIACGFSHSLALNEWGQVFSWGSDMSGQLGQENGQSVPAYRPKIIKGLASNHIVQIASGSCHSMALSNTGELFVWGSNKFGQLGLGNESEKINRPTEIKSLRGIPIAFIACGAYHSFVISKSGAVFGWGKNTSGQLGLNDDKSRQSPAQLRTLRSLGVRFIACGEEFSVFLTLDGGVFTCGAGTYGQLGHGGCSNEMLPRMVMELMGSTITQISCGSRHTLALIASRGRVYGFGLGGSGQLGTRTIKSSLIPQVVLGPWVSSNGSTLLNHIDENSSETMAVKRIFSGGDHCLVSATEFLKKIPPDDCRFYYHKSQILFITHQLAEECTKVAKDQAVDLDLLSNVESIFKSLSCINCSFLLPNDQHLCCSSRKHGVDIQEARTVFDFVRKIENETIKQIIWDCITNELLPSLTTSPGDVETLRVYIILPLYHEFVNSKRYLKLHSPFSSAVLTLSQNAKKILEQWWMNESVEYYEMLIQHFKSVVFYIIHFGFNNIRTQEGKKIISMEPNLNLALNMLLNLYKMNKQRKQKVAYENFYIQELNDVVDLQQDYLNWMFNRSANTLYLCSYPFVFDVLAKTRLLQADQEIQMHHAMDTAARRGLMLSLSGVPVVVSQFCLLNVSRENLVADTLREISQIQTSDLKKPLKVKFHGEEAEDAGGVRKEFFILVLKAILDPKYGMFKDFEDSRAIWFSDCSFEGEEMYMLIGAICGLAIYNFTIINLPFPLALFKKLLKEPVDISDLRDMSPALANSMQSILDYTEDDLETVFGLNFEISYDVFGETQTQPLKPNGSDILVTQENKMEFVDLYIDFIFNKSVEKQFKGFCEGFMKVCGGGVLDLFQANELMAVVVGNEDYDWEAFESEAEYKNGFSSGDQTIRWFWEVFHELPESEKRKFLMYLTGSDRIPIEGMKAIKIQIQPTTDEKFLPVAHTCFNLLDLPRYSTKERLKYKLLQAIQQTQGFHLV